MTPQEFLDELGIKSEAQFIPFSQSRNAKKTWDPSEYSLNWIITISKNDRPGSSIKTDFQQGIGHIPNPKRWTYKTHDQFEALKKICEKGRKIKNPENYIGELGEKLDEPKLTDVMECLIIDADVINYANFEDWASIYGYDPDSRKAEEIYKLCLETALKLRALMGDENIEKLRNLFNQ